MKTHLCKTLLLCFGWTFFTFATSAAQAGTMTFGPTPYLSEADRPDGFFCELCDYVLEDFEDNDFSDTGLTFDNGRILPPNYVSGGGDPVTDSVDADTGVIDGSGSAAHSYFYAGQSITVTFPEPVTAAGLVWTDGDVALTNVILAAFDADLNLIESIDAGKLGDAFYTGETAEDRFLGIQSLLGIAQLTITNAGDGAGIEIDHIQFQNCPECIPEPSAISLLLLGMISVLGWNRRRT